MFHIRSVFGKDIVERVIVGAGVLLVGALMLFPYLLSGAQRSVAAVVPCLIVLTLLGLAAREFVHMAAIGGWQPVLIGWALFVAVGLGVALALVFVNWQWYLVLLLGTFATDSFALLGGRVAKALPRYSTHAMTSSSREKTMEGLVTGVVVGMAVTYAAIFLLVAYCGLVVPRFGYLFAALVPFYAVWGDLGESQLKRAYGLKDSGTCLGPHGGILDRLDSVSVVFVSVGLAALVS
jgi:CDP-diglyceride synthetase